MSKPDWKDAPEWAQWWAEDGDGTSFWYEEEPRQDGVGYLASMRGGRVQVATLAAPRIGPKEPRPKPVTQTVYIPVAERALLARQFGADRTLLGPCTITISYP